MREVILRLDRRIRAMEESNARMREENRVYFQHLDAEIQEHRAETRAQTQALFRLLDRLDGGGAASA